jgi:hypothetical protein
MICIGSWFQRFQSMVGLLHSLGLGWGRISWWQELVIKEAARHRAARKQREKRVKLHQLASSSLPFCAGEALSLLDGAICIEGGSSSFSCCLACQSTLETPLMDTQKCALLISGYLSIQSGWQNSPSRLQFPVISMSNGWGSNVSIVVLFYFVLKFWPS